MGPWNLSPSPFKFLEDESYRPMPWQTLARADGSVRWRWPTSRAKVASSCILAFLFSLLCSMWPLRPYKLYPSFEYALALPIMFSPDQLAELLVDLVVELPSKTPHYALLTGAGRGGARVVDEGVGY
jgi:hypothetical protein